MVTMWQALAHFFGLDSASGIQYLWWSGVGSDLGELAIAGGALALFRKHNCHVKRCPRIGRFAVDGTPYVTCAKHHPTVPDDGPTHSQLFHHWGIAGRRGNHG